MNCPVCETLITWQHGWPACACDINPKLKLTVRQAAQFLHMSRGGVYHLISDGYLRADTTARPVRVAMFTIKAYLAADHAAHAYFQQVSQAGRP